MIIIVIQTIDECFGWKKNSSLLTQHDKDKMHKKYIYINKLNYTTLNYTKLQI